VTGCAPENAPENDRADRQRDNAAIIASIVVRGH